MQALAAHHTRSGLRRMGVSQAFPASQNPALRIPWYEDDAVR